MISDKWKMKIDKWNAENLQGSDSTTPSASVISLQVSKTRDKS